MIETKDKPIDVDYSHITYLEMNIAFNFSN